MLAAETLLFSTAVAVRPQSRKKAKKDGLVGVVAIAAAVAINYALSCE